MSSLEILSHFNAMSILAKSSFCQKQYQSTQNNINQLKTISINSEQYLELLPDEVS